MKKNKILFMLTLFCLVTPCIAMELVYTPIISGKIPSLKLEEELTPNKLKTSANLAVSASGRYIVATQKNKLCVLDLSKTPKNITKQIDPEHTLLINDHTKPSNQPMPLAIVEQNNELLICSAVNMVDNKTEIIIHKVVNNKSHILYKKTIAGHVHKIAFNNEGSHLAIAYKQPATISVFSIKDIKQNKPIRTFPQKSEITALTFSPDNNTILASTDEGVLYFLPLDKEKSKSVIIQKNINTISYINKGTIKLTSKDGGVAILNNEGELKKSVYSVFFDEVGAHKRNNVATAPHSLAHAFYLTHTKDNSNEAISVEFQVDNKIFTLHTAQLNIIFVKKDQGPYANFFQGYLECLSISDVMHHKYTIAALTTDSQIHIWHIPVSNKFRRLKSGTSRVLDGRLTQLKNVLSSENTKIKKADKEPHYISHHGYLPKKRSLKELIAEVKKERKQQRKHARPAPPPLSRVNTTIIDKSRTKTNIHQRSYSVGSGAQLIDNKSGIFDIIHKQIDLNTKINMLKTLLSNKKSSNVNEQDKYGNTALYWEVQRAHTNTVKLLLQHKANPNTKNKEGNSPLHAAVQKSNYEIAKILLKHGSNPNIQNNVNNTPAHYAAKNNAHKIIAMLLKAKAYSCIPNKDGNTILHVALIYSNLHVVHDIIKTGVHATLSFQNQEGNSPLHIAVAKKLNDIALKLMKKKIQLNVQNYNGDTPLHLAVHFNNHQMIRVLTKKGALFDIPNNEGKTALDLMK